MMWYFYIPIALFTYVFISSIGSFAKNYSAAKKTGLPIIISPVQRMNIPWMLAQHSLAPLLALLPLGLGYFARYSSLDYWFEDKYHLHEQVGKTFMFVSPGKNELHTVDPLVKKQIYARRRDFEKSEEILNAARVYGNSLATVSGPDWQRHRRITASPFNERCFKLVWDESIRQTQQLMAYWSENGAAGSKNTTEDLTEVALNILVLAAFGESRDSRGSQENELEAMGQKKSRNDVDVEMSSGESISLLASQVRLLTVIPRWFFALPASFMPTQNLKQLVTARVNLDQQMKEMIGNKKAEIARGESTDASFLSVLVSKSNEAQHEKHAIGSSGGGLSEDEIYGNLFFFHIAGHETSAGVLAYAVHLLAAFPEWQRWVHEEVDAIYKPHIDVGKMEYKETSPKLKRCLAIMFEILRLYGPTPFIMKSAIGPDGQDLEIDGRICRIPPNTLVMPNAIASQTLPEYWGEDSLEWKPDRWFKSTSLSENDSTVKGDGRVNEDSFYFPAEAEETFLPWSGGARVCPGKKFSQVEFVAVISLLLSRYSIEIVREGGESEQEAQERCVAVINNSVAELTLKMIDPTSIRLKILARK
ncbi:hypothetical protein WAI453_009006 [Rhynchosporium graminicola]